MSNAWGGYQKNLLIDGSNSMAINLNVGNYRVVNVSAPVGQTDAVNKNYVDNTVGGLYLKTDGSNTMSADLNVGTHK